MATPHQSERSQHKLKPRFPRLQFLRRRRADQLAFLQDDLADMIAEHRQAGHGWFATSDQDGMVQIRPTQ